MAKGPGPNFSGKCKDWPRGKATGVPKTERLVCVVPYVNPYIGHFFFFFFAGRFIRSVLGTISVLSLLSWPGI